MLKKIHKALSVYSLMLNGSTLCSRYINPQIVQVECQKFEEDFPNGLFRNVYESIKSLQWNQLIVNQQNVSLLSPDGIVKSGIAGLMELEFSKYVFGQTTHFGIVYPTLVLFCGNNWNSDSKLLCGLAAVGAFEIAYWWSHDDDVDSDM